MTFVDRLKPQREERWNCIKCPSFFFPDVTNQIFHPPISGINSTQVFFLHRKKKRNGEKHCLPNIPWYPVYSIKIKYLTSVEF